MVELEKEVINGELEGLAAFVHGSLCSLHVLGIFYNLKKKNYWDAGFHFIAAGYDYISARGHNRKYKNAN